MHCKHCGNQIENDSKFCSFCGGKIEPIGQFTPPVQPVIQVQTETISAPIQQTNASKLTNAFLVIGLADFGFTSFWTILQLIARNKEEGYKIYGQLEPITKPLGIINSVIIIFLCFLYSKKKEHKTIFVILGACLLVWRIYDTYVH